MYESDGVPDLSEIGGHWDDRPVRWHGQGLDQTWVYPGRRIARIPGVEWPNEPENCRAGLKDNTWWLNGQVLLCDGCGIDGT
ncbi:hypothetical protein PBI_MRMAGOO_46 [Mycobacterium phage MrMagoo]|uniref:Uncharacterized protein n=1 Tax=Mycobacterium phage MrMagoo TaxID=1927020 RepID=A0A1L6BYI9_9CAUD|nr:hypothetical protein J4U04_gp046 [Mycobacterium phage MrMagoo]APQ42151.1 hypothetical protein PBI_MRMAGOO_46 [Mycobacterium phage MrMagoo]ARM70226.1 hypothetical protein SEA_GARDENSALSA_46 [Mycobacterium phage GardenSalsa]